MCEKVVEHQPSNGDLLHIQHSGRPRNVSQRRVVGMKRQRNKRLESARLILNLAQPHQVIHAVLVVLDVPVEHRRIRPQPDLVRQPRRIQPLATRRSCGRR